jgi:glycosyltransferase involved in cell wall biosynthesis
VVRPLISIITPSFNQGRYLEECLASVATQGVSPIEHIVMDGGSSDGSVELLQNFAKNPSNAHLHWASEQDRGQSHALNKGFRAAQGEFIGWLNADDRYRTECLSRVLRVFREHPDVDVIYGDYTWINGVGNVLQLRREIEFSRFILLYHHVLYIPTTAMFFRRRILDAGHFLNETLHYAMDFEFLLRLSMLGYNFMHVPGFMADFRFHPASKSSQYPSRQLREHDEIMHQYSPLLRSLSPGVATRVLSVSLRALAAMRRYSEKALRGYYFTQFRPAALRPSL